MTDAPTSAAAAGPADVALRPLPARARLRRVAAPLDRRLLAWRSSRLVRETWEFRKRQLHPTPGANLYTLRRGGRSILIRHRQRDARLLLECFGSDPIDEPPPSVIRGLARRGPELRIADLGAGTGLRGLHAVDRYPGVTVVGFESDSGAAEVHDGCALANGLADRWTLRREHVGATVVPELAGFDLIRVNLGGGEWELLADPGFAGLEFVACELDIHGRSSPGPDPRAAARRLAAAAGFELIGERARVPAGPGRCRATVWIAPAGLLS